MNRGASGQSRKFNMEDTPEYAGQNTAAHFPGATTVIGPTDNTQHFAFSYAKRLGTASAVDGRAYGMGGRSSRLRCPSGNVNRAAVGIKRVCRGESKTHGVMDPLAIVVTAQAHPESRQHSWERGW